MFKIDNFAEEICQSMEKQLVANQTDDINGFSKLSKAIDLLNTAAEIFDQSGMIEESNDVTNILASIASKLQK